MDKHPLKRYPIVGACGLNCGLCPAYHRGETKCPGCCGPDFWQRHPGCAFITCCVKRHNLETCAQCADSEKCEKVTTLFNFAKQRDTLISYKPVPANFAFIRKHGIEEFVQLELEKQKLLKYLLENYNEGRSKSFYCTAFQLIPLSKLKRVVTYAEKGIPANADLKEKARIIKAAISKLAGILQIDLKLRK